MTLREWVERRGLNVNRIELGGAIPVAVSRGKHFLLDTEEREFRTSLDTWVMVEADDMKRWPFVVKVGEWDIAATWENVEAWNRDVREFTR